jgi:TolB-like protein/DNA-binding CsgD family transcriptional regulator
MLRAAGDPTAGLSDREQTVAAKFAAGMTYREIGEALFIAPATVRSHLSTIYRKLNVRSKVGLANLLAANRGVDIADRPSDVTASDASGPPVIAVLPFECVNVDERWGRLADGLSADITIDLARYPDLAVLSSQTMRLYKGRSADARMIGRELSADYLLAGILQTTEQNVRVSVSLVDTRTAADVWATRYEQPASDLFAMQDRITGNVVNVLASCCGKLAGLRRDVARRKPPASLRAYEAYLLGGEQHDRFTRESNLEAIRLLSRAVELDPGLARAWSLLGLAYSVNAYNAFNKEVSASIECWAACTERALSLDPGDCNAHLCMGDLRATRGDLRGAAEEHERALELAPNDADILAMVAGSRALVTGSPHQCIALAERAFRLNSQPPSWYYSQLGRALFAAGRYRQSLSAFRQSPQNSPGTLLFLTVGHALLGEIAQARAVRTRLTCEFTSFTTEGFIRSFPVTNPMAIEAIRHGKRLAELP